MAVSSPQSQLLVSVTQGVIQVNLNISSINSADLGDTVPLWLFHKL